jgi:hypothetical protein
MWHSQPLWAVKHGVERHSRTLLRFGRLLGIGGGEHTRADRRSGGRFDERSLCVALSIARDEEDAGRLLDIEDDGHALAGQRRGINRSATAAHDRSHVTSAVADLQLDAQQMRFGRDLAGADDRADANVQLLHCSQNRTTTQEVRTWSAAEVVMEEGQGCTSRVVAGGLLSRCGLVERILCGVRVSNQLLHFSGLKRRADGRKQLIDQSSDTLHSVRATTRRFTVSPAY